jgi:protein-S-isoprenylcysteine O-methyltransferase Ste14
MAVLLVAAQFGLIALILAFGALPFHSLTALVTAAIGALLGAWTLAFNRPGNFNIRPVPKAAGTLVTNGPYRWVRHPMYSALLLVSTSFTLASPGVHHGWACLIALTVVLAIKARYEEALLGSKFAGYAAYAGRTRRFLPGVY